MSSIELLRRTSRLALPATLLLAGCTGALYVPGGTARVSVNGAAPVAAMARAGVAAAAHLEAQREAELTVRTAAGAQGSVAGEGSIAGQSSPAAEGSAGSSADGQGSVEGGGSVMVEGSTDLVANADVGGGVSSSTAGGSVDVAGGSLEVGAGAGSAAGVAVAVGGGAESASDRAMQIGEPSFVARDDGDSVLDGSAAVQGSAEVSGSVDVEAHARVGHGASARVGGSGGGGSVGVRGSLGGLLEGTVTVDGRRLDLEALRALATLEASVDTSSDARLPTNAAIAVTAELEHDALAFDGGETNLVVQVRGGQAPAAAGRGRLRVHLVIDRSSSMQSSWPQVLAAGRSLIERLRADDQLQIVVYGTRGAEVLPLGPVGDGRRARAALAEVRVGGGTNIEAGLELAYGAATTDRRADDERSLVLLVSDGVPNGGAFGAEELAPMAAEARRTSGCTTTVIGLGSQFDEDVLRSVATAGRGGYHLARTAHHLGPVLSAELDAQAHIAARDVDVHVDLPPGVELIGVQDGEAGVETVTGGVALRLPQLRQDEERRFLVRVRVAGSRRARTVATVRADYRVSGSRRTERAQKQLAISFAANARVRADAVAGMAVVDADLGQALNTAATSVRNGDGAAAASALVAHVARAEARVEWRTSGTLRRRTQVVGRLAQALGALTGDADWTERRQTGLAIGHLSLRL